MFNRLSLEMKVGSLPGGKLKDEEAGH